MGEDSSMMVDPKVETTGSRGGITFKNQLLAASSPDMSCSLKAFRIIHKLGGQTFKT